MYAIGALKKYIINGDKIKAIIEPTETYFVEYVIIAQTIAIIAPTCQFKARIVPTPEATDLPPLKLRKQDIRYRER